MDSKRFNIFALMTVKNEDDIIEETILDAVKWADKIFVMDNMSNDTTWDKLIKLAKDNDKIVLWGRYGGKFHLALRQILFNDFRHFSKDGDWWCRLDGDEFYIDDPREFLTKLEPDIDYVYNASFQYYYTEDDYEKEKSINNNEQSVTVRLKNYKCNHSEIRFIKDRKLLCWPQYSEWPANLLKTTSKRIRLKHYQYRTLDQIKARLIARNAKDSGSSFTHEKVTASEWYKRRGFELPESKELQDFRIVLKKDLDNSDNYIYHDDKLPNILYPTLKRKVKSGLITFYMKYILK